MHATNTMSIRLGASTFRRLYVNQSQRAGSQNIVHSCVLHVLILLKLKSDSCVFKIQMHVEVRITKYILGPDSLTLIKI